MSTFVRHPRPVQDTAPARIQVTTATEAVDVPDTLALYLELTRLFGDDQVYLLESPSGPERDCRLAAVGFGELLSVSITAGLVEVTGVQPLRQAVVDRIRHLLVETEGGLRLATNRDLWGLLKELTALFDAQGSDSEFRFGFLTFLGYDTARYIEDLPRLIDGEADTPDVTLVLHQGMVRVDLAAHHAELLVHRSRHWPAPRLQEVRAALARSAPDARRIEGAEPGELFTVSDETDSGRYAGQVAGCLEHIARGDIYQVQIGHELEIGSSLAPVDAYHRLHRRNPSPYMYLAPLAGATVVGASPELLVRVEGGQITMRPIAGTVARNGDDEATAERLRGDPKEIAEHVMLVDLCRNDIGRVCAADTLAVPEMLVVEQFSHVQHLVSTVVGTAAGGVDAFDVIRAVFPAGTMTGAPKIRAMEIIEATETSRRGLYAGALGLVDVGGYANLALCIRTLIHRDGVYRTRSSAGVVADSTAEREWRETVAKSAAALWAVTGRERT
ncbi:MULTISPECIES: anthranilate synthase component I family protein [unclassified Streptomyces]|uniref:anthranilate synthase component I family protein n=1 Tax=unclassified Streptomyces TaxID=2593676 RepID=UPI00225141C6|nr:anthranilate synthase component I family protein [Streptomyces sp. NBC_00338]MCX5141813.1 anthranilate synthase component I family protein [Streptomyces sp. NBC_00338]